MSTGHGYGYIRDSHDTSQDPTTRHLFGALRGLPPREASLEQFVALAGIKDQKMTSACTGFAFARAVHVRCAAMGKPIAWPSETGIYVVGRAVDEPGQPLADSGAQPNSVMRGCQQWGVASDSQWPPGGFDAAYDAADKNPDGTLAADSFINQLPDLEELEDASLFKVLGWYRVASEGVQRELDVQQALAEGYPVAIGTNVDRAFEAYAGGKNGDGSLVAVQAPVEADVLGGHMMCIVGYAPDPASQSRVLYRGVNSWGSGWGDGGLYWADSSFLRSPDMTDIYVCTVAPTEAGLAAHLRAINGG